MNRFNILRKEMQTLFEQNPNNIYSIKELKKIFNGAYTDTEYFMAIKALFEKGVVNRRMLMHQSFYWLRRKE